VIWGSILGVAPFTLILPYASLEWTGIFDRHLLGFILASAFSAILVYAQELLPGRIGMVSGLFSDLLSAWAAWVRRCWAWLQITPASSWSTKSVLSFHFWGY
jgi:hypothetical protein